MLGLHMERRGNSPPAGFLHRMLKTGCAVLILALGVFAASPMLHKQLHATQHASAEDGCAVTLFAGGVSVAAPMTALPPSTAHLSELAGVVSQEIFLDSPRYLLQPERGPPAA